MSTPIKTVIVDNLSATEFELGTRLANKITLKKTILDSLSFDTTTNKLTATSLDGTPTLIDLSALATTVTADGLGTKLTGNGTSATPLKVDGVIDPASSPALTVSTTGFKLDTAILMPVELVDAFGVHVGFIGA